MPTSAIVAGGSGVLSAGTGLLQSISAGKQAKRYQEMIDNYQRQEITNPYENLQVSTLGADRQREDLARSVSTMANNASMGGSRAIVGLAPNILQQQQDNEAKIVADLDQQEKQRQQLIAQGAGMVQQMTEQRENQDLAGLGQGLATANQNKANGINTFAQGLMSLGMSAASGTFDKQTVGASPDGSTAGTYSALAKGLPAIGGQMDLTPIQDNSAGLITAPYQAPDYFNTKNRGAVYNPFMKLFNTNG